LPGARFSLARRSPLTGPGRGLALYGPLAHGVAAAGLGGWPQQRSRGARKPGKSRRDPVPLPAGPPVP